MVKGLVIAFCGGMGSGKDTQGVSLAQRMETEYDVQFEKFSFAGCLKDEVSEIASVLHTGFNNLERGSSEYKEKLDIMAEVFYATPSEIEHVLDIFAKHGESLEGAVGSQRTPAMREMLQYWGTDVRRNTYEDYWVDLAEEILTSGLKQGKNYYVTDARFVNELRFLSRIGAKIVFLDCDEATRVERIARRDGRKPTQEQLNHSSETSYKDYVGKIDLRLDVAKRDLNATSREVFELVRNELEMRGLI